jgi:hypothetical protein
MASFIPIAHPPQAVLATILQDERDGPRQALEGLFLRTALAVGARDLRAVGDEPLVVALNNGRELVSHSASRLP